jgi:hypothetical protein
VSHDLDALIAAELQQLRMLIEPRRPLIERSLRGPVELESLDALSALLHSAYTAMERILVHMAKRGSEYETVQAKVFMWHSVLLNTLAAPTDKRPAIITEELHDHLKAYLGFRHVFRHAYLHELQWNKMRGLVENLDEVIGLFESEITAHLERGN